MDEQLTIADVEESERLGDEAVANADLDQARRHYQFASVMIMAIGQQNTDAATNLLLVDMLKRIGSKVTVLPSLEERLEELQQEIADAKASGNLAHAAHMSFVLGDLLADEEENEGAESAYRQSVALARQVDAADPELMLAAFISLSRFLAPSDESVALAAELSTSLVTRDDMYHPMRAAEALLNQAAVTLQLAEADPGRLEEALDFAGVAIRSCDGVCFHGEAQALQRQTAQVLRANGRYVEAAQWQADADQYDDWGVFSDQQISGHVHLWDVRVDTSNPTRPDDDSSR